MDNPQIDNLAVTPQTPVDNLSEKVENANLKSLFADINPDRTPYHTLDGQSLNDLMTQSANLQAQNQALLDNYNTGSAGTYGQGSAMDKGIKDLDKFLSRTSPTIASLNTPVNLGAGKDLERYTNSGNFAAFGYTGNPNQEFKYGNAMTWGDTIGRAIGGGSQLAADTFIEGWKGWGRMADALFTLDSSKLMGSPTEQADIAEHQRKIFDKYAIYDTETSKDSLWNRQFFGNMLQQSGFAVGAGLQFAMESFLTAGLGKLFSGVGTAIEFAEFAKNAGTANALVNDARKVASAVTRTEAFGKSIGDIAKNLVPFYGTAEEMIKLNQAGAGALQLGMVLGGGVKRALSEFNMARSESIFESASTYTQLRDRLVDEYTQKNGMSPDAVTLEKISQSAENAAHDNFWTNIGVLSVMNRIQFDNVYKSFSSTRNLFNEGAASLADEAFTVTGQVAGKETKQAFKKSWFFGELGAVGQIAETFGAKKAAWEATKSIGRSFTKIEGSEGIQELIQNASDKGLEDYYYDLYHGKQGYTGRLGRVMDSIQNPLTDMEGMKTFLMGALTGALISPGSKAISRINERAAESREKTKYESENKDNANAPSYQNRDERIQESVDLVNALYKDPGQFKKEWIANVKVQNKVADTMEEAAKNHNNYVFHNAKDSGFSKTIASAIKLDMFDSLRDSIKELGQDLNDEEFKQMFNMDASKQNRTNAKAFMGNISQQIEEYNTTWHNLKDKYGDKILPELYKNNSANDYASVRLSKIALDDAIEMLTTNIFKSKQVVKRASDLQTKITQNENIGGSASQLITKMGSEQATDDHIAGLEKEIKNLEFGKAEKALDETGLKQLAEKKQELEHVTTWKEAHADIMQNSDESYSPAAEERAYKSFTDLLNLFNKQAKLNVTVSKSDADSTFIDFVDYLRLNRDSKDYVDAMNLLAQPRNMDLVINAIKSSTTLVNARMHQEHLNEVKGGNNKGKTEEEENFEVLEKHTVVEEKDNTFTILSPQGRVVFKNIATKEEAEKTAAELDEILKEAKKTAPVLEDYLKERYNEIKEGNPDLAIDYDTWRKNGGANEYIKKYEELYGKSNLTELAKTDFVPDATQKIIKEKDGLLLVENYAEDLKTVSGYIILNKDGTQINIELNDEKYSAFDPAGWFTVKKDAEMIFDAAAEVNKRVLAENGEFEFDGKKIKFGTILIDSNGRKFQVLSKGQPEMQNGVPSIQVKGVNISTLSYISSLKNYKLESEFVKGTALPTGQRLQRTNELNRIYAHNGDTTKLQELLLNVSREELSKRISVKITKVQNPTAQKKTFADNDYLFSNGDPYTIAILYDGETIGYATYYNRYSYADGKGTMLSLNQLGAGLFEHVFNVGSKDVNQSLKDFNNSYKQSESFWNKAIKLYEDRTDKSADNIILDPGQTSKEFNIYPMVGEYDFVEKGQEETAPTLEQLDYSTIDGNIYVIDRGRRYTSNGMFETGNNPIITDISLALQNYDELLDIINKQTEDERFKDGYDKLINYGRYIAVVKLPNGKVRFVELTTGKLSEEQKQDLVNKINTASKESKANNLVEGTKKGELVSKVTSFNDKVNSEISTMLYLATKRTGTDITISMNAMGNLKIDFFNNYNKISRSTIITASSNQKDALVFQNFDELIDTINKQIKEHDATTKDFKKKIDIQFTADDFKTSLPKNSGVEEIKQLQSKVNKGIVKNTSLNFTVPTTDVKKTNTTKKAVPKTENVEVNAAEAEANAALLKSIAAQNNPGGQANEEIKKKKLAASQRDEILNQIKTAKMQLRSESIKSEPNLSREEREKIIEQDPKIQNLNKDLAAVNKTLSLKVVTKLDNQQIESLDKFTAWVKENLPDFISVEEIQNLKKAMLNGNITVGYFYSHMEKLRDGLQAKGKINVAKESPFKYHEAFHAIFRMLLSDTKINQLLATAKMEVLKNLRQQGKTFDTAIQEMIDSSPETYNKLSRKELEERLFEEHLADKFDDWKSNIRTETDTAHKSFFRKLLDLIQNFFRRLTDSNVEELFKSIDAGKYKNVSVASNRFTRALSIAPTEKILKAIKVGEKTIIDEDGIAQSIPVYLSEQEGSRIASTIAALYHTRIENSTLNTKGSDIFDSIINDYSRLYDPYAEYNRNVINLEDLENKYNLFTDPELIDILKESVDTHLTLMGYKDALDEDSFDSDNDEYGDKATADNRREKYSIGGFGSLSKFLRRYIATATYEVTDSFGNEFFRDAQGNLTNEKLIEAVDSNTIYNGVLKALANTDNENQMLQRLELFSRYNQESKAFYNKFVEDTGLTLNSDGTYEITQQDGAHIFQAVIKGFQQYYVDYLFINKDIRSQEARINKANSKDAARNQFSIWYNAYVSKYERAMLSYEPGKSRDAFVKNSIKPLNKLYTLFDVSNKTKKYSDSQLDYILDGISKDLFKNIGIKLSPLYLKYSYASLASDEQLTTDLKDIKNSFNEVEAITREDISELINTLKASRNPFGKNNDAQAVREQIEEETSEDNNEEKQEQGVGGNVSRINKMAGGNAVFDETVSTTSFMNGEGELVYAHQQPTFDLVAINSLRQEWFREKLSKDPFLETNYLLNNPLFQALAKNIKVDRIESIKSSHFSTNTSNERVEDKRLDVNKNKGLTYGSMSDREMLISLIELYGYNKKFEVENGTDDVPAGIYYTAQHLMGVLEASNTGDTVALPVIKGVTEKDGRISLSTEAKEILFKEVEREYDRITRTQKQLEDSNFTDFIDDFHNGKKRGLSFYKMDEFLTPELTSRLEEAARNGESIEKNSKDVYAALDTYWNGYISEFTKHLIDENIIVEGREKNDLFNSLLSEFTFKGFMDSTGKKDVRKNESLNIIPGNPAYNLAQILVNDYINSLTVNQLLQGDAAENFKKDGGIDEVKRYKGRNGSGPSIYSEVLAPKLGINHTNKTSHGVVISDPLYLAKYAGGNKEKADAQMWLTEKFLRYTLFGLGELNLAKSEILDKISRGESFSAKEMFGQGGVVEYDAQTNSIKLVYFDGKKYIKTSGLLLSKELTSIKSKGGWIARPQTEELHQLREKLEKYENNNNTVAFAVPKSASKAMRKNMAENINSISDQHFQEYDNKFWRLQVVNPSNKLVITDPTQAKQIIMAEQDDAREVSFMGAPTTIGDVKKAYMNATADRLKNNFITSRNEIFDVDKAYKELSTSIEANKITPKLGKLIKNASENLAATGADGQLLEFFKLNEDGTPKYDLNHPITLTKFTQLFLAYFSKGVMNEKIPGHSVALASNYGMKVMKRVIELDENGQPKRWDIIRRDAYNPRIHQNIKNWNNEMDRTFDGLKVGDIYLDDLRHNVARYDDKGNIIGRFTEYMMPPHFAEAMGIAPGEPIPEALRDVFGVRIPSQDKHSFVSLELVDHLPAYYGSTAIFSHELIEISGADFDIDKLYLHIKDTYVKNGKLVAFGTEKTNEGRFTEYIEYVNKSNKSYRELLRKDTNITKALKQLGLPSTVSEFVAKEKELGRELNNSVLNNKVLDAKLALQNNPTMTEVTKEGEHPIAFQAASTDPLKSLVEELIKEFPTLHDFLIEKGRPIESLLGKQRSFKNNKEGAANIGPAVNALIAFSLLNTFKINLRSTKTQGGEERNMFILNIDGENFSSYSETRAYNLETKAYDGERKFFIISTLVSAMTDNAKERLAARLGLNIDAVGIVSNMVALGVPLKTAIIYVNQPIIKEYYSRIAATKYRLKTAEEEKLFKSSIGRNLLKEVEQQLGKDFDIPALTTEILNDNIKSQGSNAEIQYSILEKFLQFDNQTQYYNAISQVTKLSKGMGTNWEDVDAIGKNIETLGLNSDNPAAYLETDVPFDNSIMQVMLGTNTKKDHHAFLANYIKIYKQLTNNLAGTVFLERTGVFNNIKNTVLANLTKFHATQEEFELTLKNDLISYIGLKAYMNYLKESGKINKLKALDNALIYDADAFDRPEGFVDIIDSVNMLRDYYGKDKNYFISNFINVLPTTITNTKTGDVVYNPSAKGGINTLDVNTWAKLSLQEQEKLQDSFLEMYSNSSIVDPNTGTTVRDLAINMFHYLLVKDGGQFKSGSFLRFMPNVLFEDIMKQTGTALSIMKMESLNNNDEVYKAVFGVTQDQMFNEFMINYTKNINNVNRVKKFYPGTEIGADLIEKNKLVPIPGWSPSSFIQNQDPTKGITIDLFAGIREVQWFERFDEMGNSFMIQAKETGTFSEEEIKKLAWNKTMLEAKGFRIEQLEDKKSVIHFPYVIKHEYDDIIHGKQTSLFVLKSLGKQTDKKLDKATTFVGKDEVIAKGIKSTYVPYDPLGSRKQWAMGAMFGAQPSTEQVMRKRRTMMSSAFDNIEFDVDSLDNIDVVNDPEHEFSYELSTKFNITYEVVDGSKFVFRENGKIFETDAKTPSELYNSLAGIDEKDIKKADSIPDTLELGDDISDQVRNDAALAALFKKSDENKDDELPCKKGPQL